MSQPLVAFVMPKPVADACFAAEDLERLKQRCAVRDASVDRVEQGALPDLGRDADVWITGWGTPSLTEEAFAAAPALKLIAHSAGSTQRLVPADL